MSDISKLLIEQIETARSEKQSLNIIGGGSKAFMGRASQGEPLNVSNHSGIVNYHPVELVMTVRAGTRIEEIETALDENNQMLSFEPPHFGGKATIGGTLACNQSGPARPWSGSVRDMVLGIKLINGRGEHLNFGGQVMKNVAGYDVSRLQAGAMGTLGVITEVSLKVLPKPAATLTLMLEMSQQEAISRMNELAGQPKPLNAACWFDGRLYLRLCGAETAVNGTATQWGGERIEKADAPWVRLREQQLDFFTGDEALWRFSVKSSAPPIDFNGQWLVDWGGAQRWLRGDHDKNALEQLAEVASGQVSLFRGGDRNSEVFHTQSRALELTHKRLKFAFDPDGLFNPGRLYSWM